MSLSEVFGINREVVSDFVSPVEGKIIETSLQAGYILEAGWGGDPTRTERHYDWFRVGLDFVPAKTDPLVARIARLGTVSLGKRFCTVYAVQFDGSDEILPASINSFESGPAFGYDSDWVGAKREYAVVELGTSRELNNTEWASSMLYADFDTITIAQVDPTTLLE